MTPLLLDLCTSVVPVATAATGVSRYFTARSGKSSQCQLLHSTHLSPLCFSCPVLLPLLLPLYTVPPNHTVTFYLKFLPYGLICPPSPPKSSWLVTSIYTWTISIYPSPEISLHASFGFQQFTDFPTHKKGHKLDLICCSGLTPSNYTADELPVTDHFLLTFNTTLTLSSIKLPRRISFRNLKDINSDILRSKIDSILIPDSLSNPDDLVKLYNNSLQAILDSLAPVKNRSISFTTSAPWFTPELRTMKARGRQLE